MTDIRVDNFAGKPLLYDRSAPGHYGRTGISFRPFVNPVFAQACEACFSELFARLRQRADLIVTFILSGGVSRAGTGASFHHKNRAFDLDGLLFDDGSNWVANTFPQRPQLYLGMEAILRRHFGTVLSYDYNRAHEDHFHFDNGTPIGFKPAAKSHVIFIQNVIALVYGSPIGRDGVWGPETESAIRSLRNRFGIGPLSTAANWRDLLDGIADEAMTLEQESRQAGG
jgi:hypothetical protein